MVHPQGPTNNAVPLPASSLLYHRGPEGFMRWPER